MLHKFHYPQIVFRLDLNHECYILHFILDHSKMSLVDQVICVHVV